MSLPNRTHLGSILLGDELGQIKLIQLGNCGSSQPEDVLHEFDHHDHQPAENRHPRYPELEDSPKSSYCYRSTNAHTSRHRIVQVLDDCIQKQPAASRSIVSIRPISNIYESNLDTTDKPNSLFLITNRSGQVFVCDTDAVRARLFNIAGKCHRRLRDFRHGSHSSNDEQEDDDCQDQLKNPSSPLLSPIYYNLSGSSPVCGAQPINQTNILVVYQNGDIQQVTIGQDVLQSSLKIRRKAIKLLGLGYNSDARAVHWRIDGASGVFHLDPESSASQINDSDPLADLVVGTSKKSPKRRLNKHRHQDQYNQSPCIQSRKHNEGDRLVPTQVINMLTSRADQYKSGTRAFKWSSILSLNMIYRKLALYDLVAADNMSKNTARADYKVDTFKLSADRLAVAGRKYTVRVYDLQTQKPIYNCLTGAAKNPIRCSPKGDPCTVGDLDWLGGNKTTKRQPCMLATCSGVDSIVKVYDLRSPKPAFFIDLTHETENKWQPYENHARGCVFTSICASGAPYSTAVPSQQLTVGSTNGQMYVIDLRFVAKTFRTMGRLSGFCGGSLREIRFVSETFETSKIISCATDRFVRVHRLHTSFTSVVSEKLDTKVFLGTKPTCIQPVCDEIWQKQYFMDDLQSSSSSAVSCLSAG